MEQKREQKINWGNNITNHPRLEKEITIKLNPKKAIKGFVVIAVLFAIFFMGRLSAESASCGLSDISDFFAGTSAAVVDNPSEETEEEIAGAETEVEEIGEEEAEFISDLIGVEAETETEITGTETEEDEEVVTTYGKVALAIDEIYKEWKGTYGKMIGFEYSVKNGEEGTVLPSYFIMTVDGYDDIERRFDVPYDSIKVKAGETLTTEAAITGGFMYNPATINIQKAKIKVYLYDAKNNVMALSSQQMDLSGEEEE